MKITKTDTLKVDDSNEIEISYTVEDDNKEKHDSFAATLSISGYLNKDNTFATLQIEITGQGAAPEEAGNNFLHGTDWLSSLMPDIKVKVLKILNLEKPHD